MKTKITYETTESGYGRAVFETDIGRQDELSPEAVGQLKQIATESNPGCDECSVDLCDSCGDCHSSDCALSRERKPNCDDAMVTDDDRSYGPNRGQR